MKVSNPAKVLALDLVAFIVLDVLLTPVAGLETRLPTHLGEAARGISRELGAPRWPHAAEG